MKHAKTWLMRLLGLICSFLIRLAVDDSDDESY